jgi:hypothetical protein
MSVDDDLAFARHHVAELERLIAEQRERIEHARRGGSDITQSERLLENMLSALQLMRVRQALIEREWPLGR